MKRLNARRFLYVLPMLAVVSGLLSAPVVSALPVAPDPQSPVLQAGAVTATVKVPRLHVRRIPSTAGSIRGILTRDETVILIGRTRVSDWVETDSRFGRGWLDARYISTDLSILTLPVTEDFIPPFATVVAAPAAVVRLGPTDEYVSIGIYPTGTEFDVIGLHESNTFVQVRTKAGVGWIATRLVKVTGYLGDLRETNREVLPMAMINTFRLRVRTGPSLDAPSFAVVGLGEKYTIVAMTLSELWYEITGPFGTGWVASDYVQVIGVLDPLHKPERIK